MQPILRVNLSTGETSQVSIPLEWEQQYLGGASLAARLLYDSLTPDLDPFSPLAPLLFLNGPLTGTAGPAVGRFVVCARSPATRLWAESNCGGFWGPELRMAGYDGLWIDGCAGQLSYLFIQDDRVEIRAADHLQGYDTYQTQTAIEQELGAGKLRVAAIGPAGENRIPFAVILCDHGRVAGRTGMGAVMGAKNLKAVAVQGHGKVPVFDLQAYLPMRSESNRLLKTDNQSMVMRQLGSASSAEFFDYLGIMPKRYYQERNFPEEIKTSGSYVADNFLAGVSACHACVIACGRVVRLEDGAKRKGPEYETMVGFGPNLGLNDPILTVRLGELCDRLGLDTISLSNTLGLAYRLYEIGKISTQDTTGFELTWGNPGPLEALINSTAQRQGFGALLALGARDLGQAYGAEDEAVQVNNLEVAYQDPRGSSGMALSYATSPRGACHNQSDYMMVDAWQAISSLGITHHDRLGGPEKSAAVARHQDWRTVCNSLVFCVFANLEPDFLLPMINAVCDLEWTMAEMLLSGERGWNLKRAINNRLGLTRRNDQLPKVLLQPFRDDPDTPYPFDFNAMLDAYYTARGWDKVTGYPTQEKLRELNLDFVIGDLP